MKEDSKKILLGFADAIAAIEVVFDLLEKGHELVIFSRRKDSTSLAYCKNITIEYITAPEDNIKDAKKDLLKIIKQNSFDAMMPLDDIALWLCNEIRENISIKFIGPTSDGIEIALNKIKQIDYAKKSGLKVLDTIIISKKTDLDKITFFPLILKPALAVTVEKNKISKDAFYFISSEEDLAKVKMEWNHKTPYIAQPLIKGTGEGLFGYFNKKLYAPSSHIRLRMKNPLGSGSSACMNGSINIAEQEIIEKFLKKIKWTGIFMVEMLKDLENNYWFMELNGRPWGSMALARKKNLHYPAWAVEKAFNASFIPQYRENNDAVIVRHLGRDIIHLLAVLKGSKNKHHVVWPSRLKTIKDVLLPRKNQWFYNYKKGYLKLFIMDTLITLKNQFIKK